MNFWKNLWEEDKKKYMKFIIILFYELKEEETVTDDEKILKNIERTLRKGVMKKIL